MPKRDEKLSQALQFLLNIYNVPNACSSKEFKYSKILSIPLRDGKAWNIRLSRNSPQSTQTCWPKLKNFRENKRKRWKILLHGMATSSSPLQKSSAKKSMIMKLRTVKIPEYAFAQYSKRHMPFCWSKRQNAHKSLSNILFLYFHC